MFGRPSSNERALYERMIVILADQVDWLRSHAGTPALPVPTQAALSPGVGAGPMPKFMDEDEEILQWQADNKVLDLDDARLALQQIGAMNTDVSDYMS
jgi:hypothetical protein